MIAIGPAARRDLHDIASYLDEETLNSAISEAFLAEFERVCIHLERFPQSCQVVLLHRKSAVRRASLRRFSKYVVFYREIEGGILVQRVVHGMRNIPLLLND